MTEPLVSITCLVYNHAPYVAQALDGMLQQKTDFAFEIIVHDDASTDQSLTILQNYSARYPEIIRLIAQRENQYSKGIKPWIRYVYPLCRGQYIAWCEGDDYWTDPNKLQRQVDCLRAHPEYSSCFHETMDVWEDGHSSLHNKITEDRIFSSHDLTQSNFIAPVSYVFRRQPGQQLPSWIQTVKAGDWALFFHNALYGPIYYFKDCMAVYRKHAGGIWSRVPHDQMILEGVKAMMAIDHGCNYRYHEEFRQGVALRLAKANAKELDRLLKQDHALNAELRHYQRRKLWRLSPIIPRCIRDSLIGLKRHLLRYSLHRRENIDKNINLEITDLSSNLSMTSSFISINELNSFLSPPLTEENMDRYLIRSSILKAIKEFLPQCNGTLLDVGCGKMPYKSLILESVTTLNYIGLDIENPVYQQDVKPDLFWDGCTIPLDDCSVDCAMATELFEHLPDPEKVMREVNRVLKGNGILFFTVPFLWPLHDVPYDEYRYTPFALERHLKNCEFDNIKIKPLGGWDASLAQMIGLWTRRKPMPDAEREKISREMFPLYKKLIHSDDKFDKFSEGQMVTGLYGTAIKIGISSHCSI